MPVSRRAATRADDTPTPSARITKYNVSESPSQRRPASKSARSSSSPSSSPAAISTSNTSTQRGLPTALHFPLAAVLSLAVAGLGCSVLSDGVKAQLASVSRSQDTWEEAGVVIGWRVLEIGVAWFGGMDSLDVVALRLLTHGPTLYLLATFYDISPLTTISTLIIDILSMAIPFHLLRPLSAVHTRSSRLPNRELADWGVQIFTALLSTAIFTLILVQALRLLLPRVLVLYFGPGITSLAPAYDATYQNVLPVTALFGVAASAFIYAPFATMGRAEEDDRIDQFDPATASLGETVRMNVWGYTARNKVVIRRTVVAVMATAVNIYVTCTMVLYGVERTGAVAYAAVWAFSVLCCGLALGFVGGE